MFPKKNSGAFFNQNFDVAHAVEKLLTAEDAKNQKDPENAKKTCRGESRAEALIKF
jgi:hypothetical protein